MKNMDESYKLTEQERDIISTIQKSSNPAAALILALEIIRQLSELPPALAKPLPADLPAKP